ncbi:MAG: hypothetical protein WC477_03605 [Patescibacteria group bacterium]
MKNLRVIFSVILCAVFAIASQAFAKTLPREAGDKAQTAMIQERSYLPIVGFSLDRSWVKFIWFECHVGCLQEDFGSCIGGRRSLRYRVNGKLIISDFSISVVRLAQWKAEHEAASHQVPPEYRVDALLLREDQKPEVRYEFIEKDWMPKDQYRPPPMNPNIVIWLVPKNSDANQRNFTSSKPTSKGHAVQIGSTLPITTRGVPEGQYPVFFGATVPFN